MAEFLRLGSHCSKIGSGATPRGGKETYLDDGPFALIRSQNIHNHGFAREGLAFISEEQASLLQNVEVKSGDVLLNITGDSVARVCQVDDAILPARVNQHVAIIRPNPAQLDALFLRYFLITPSMQSHMLGLAAAGATRNALTKSMIESFRIPALDIKSQRTIASIFGALDDKIAHNLLMNETLEALAWAIFKDWFVDFGPTRSKVEGREPYLRPDIWSLFPQCLDPGGLPEGWTNGRLLEVCELKRGYDLPADKRKEGLFPIVSSSGISGTHDQPMAAGPGVVTGRYGTIGKVFYIEGDFWPLNTALYVSDFKGSEPRFIYYLLSGLDFTAYSDKGAVPGVNRNHLHEHSVTLVPREAQRLFVEVLGANWERQRLNCDEIETLTALRSLLLPKIMSGEICVNEAEKELEAVL